MAVEAKKREVVVHMKKAETQAKSGQALDSDRDGDHCGACPSVLQWDHEVRRRQDGGLGCKGSSGEDTFHYSLSNYKRSLRLEIAPPNPLSGLPLWVCG